jgi:CBS domain containing-hemolysin-like protein
MNNLSKKIAVRSLTDNCTLASPAAPRGGYGLDSPASSLMVDFNRVHAITVSDSVSVDDALEMMRVNRIRLLIVIDCNGEFAGIVSATDLMGSKAMAYANEAGIVRSEVQVKHVMLSKKELRAMARSDIDKATLGDVLHVLRSRKEQHMLVVEDSGAAMRVSGLFSAADFKRALDIDLDSARVAQSFSDLERIINENKEVM